MASTSTCVPFSAIHIDCCCALGPYCVVCAPRSAASPLTVCFVFHMAMCTANIRIHVNLVEPMCVLWCALVCCAVHTTTPLTHINIPFRCHQICRSHWGPGFFSPLFADISLRCAKTCKLWCPNGRLLTAMGITKNQHMPTHASRAMGMSGTEESNISSESWKSFPFFFWRI